MSSLDHELQASIVHGRVRGSSPCRRRNLREDPALRQRGEIVIDRVAALQSYYQCRLNTSPSDLLVVQTSTLLHLLAIVGA
jgi:hypothetical protein